MKKTIFIYVLILIIVFVIFAFLGRNDVYLFEKKVWKISHKYAAIKRDPQSQPPMAIDETIQQYRHLIEQSKNPQLSRPLYFAIADLLVIKKDFKGSRETLTKLMDLFPDQDDTIATALFNIGRTYEIEGKWDQALGFYERVHNNYQKSLPGFRIPLYIASYYRQNNDLENSIQAFDRAAKFYKTTAEEYAQKPAGLISLQMLADCYAGMNRWQDSLNILQIILTDYIRILVPAQVQVLIQRINYVATQEMDEPGAAIPIYQAFIAKWPDHPINTSLKQIIENLVSKKTQSVSVGQAPLTAQEDQPAVEAQPLEIQ